MHFFSCKTTLPFSCLPLFSMGSILEGKNVFPDEYVLSCESRPFFWKGEAYMKSQNLSPCEYVTKTKVYPVGRGLGRLLFL